MAILAVGAKAQAPSPAITPSWQEGYVVALVIMAPPAKPPASTACSCVLYAKWRAGRQAEVWGNASSMRPTSQTPTVGGIIITGEGLGHVGYITGVGSSSVTFDEANYRACQYSTRTLQLDSPVIRGYRP